MTGLIAIFRTGPVFVGEAKNLLAMQRAKA